MPQARDDKHPPRPHGKIAPIPRLPPEVRHNIWNIYYDEVLRADWQIKVDKNLKLVCKSICTDVRPIIRVYESSQHYNHDGHTQNQVIWYPGRSRAINIHRVWFYIHQPDLDERYSIPDRPIRFQRFPNLRRFDVAMHIIRCAAGLIEGNRPRPASRTVPAGLAMDEIADYLDQPDPADIKLENNYLALSDKEKMILWKTQPFYNVERFIRLVANRRDKDHWLSKVVNPAEYPGTPELRFDNEVPEDCVYYDSDSNSEERDLDDEADNSASQLLPEESKEDAENRERKEFAAVIQQMDVFLEFELHATRRIPNPDSGTWSRTCFTPPVLVVVDARRRKIVEARVIDKEEWSYRKVKGGVRTVLRSVEKMMEEWADEGYGYEDYDVYDGYAW